jgi:DNA-binding NarL/FixJ family response regulator
VVLADDYPRLVAAFRRILEPGCEVVGTVSTGHDAVNAATTLEPDVILLDLTMSDLDGIEACRRIKQLAPQTHVIIVTAIDDPDVRRAAFENGASAFLLKDRAASDLERTVQSLFDGHGRSSADG